MFTIKRFRAKNVIGFKAGLGRKNIEIDFSHMLWKTVYVIMGDNGTGKTTLMSLLMPVHTPYGVNKGFVVPGEEGLIEREYITDTGLTFLSKCVYKPDKNEPKKHTTSAFFGSVNEDGEYTEYGNGNIGVYKELLKVHLNFDESMMDWIYYDDDNGKSLVKMTDKERFDSINKHIKANKRFINAHNNANDKLKIYRSSMKNNISKLNSLRPTRELQQSLDSIELYLKAVNEKKEKLFKDITRLETQIESYGKMDSDDLNEHVFELKGKIESLTKIVKSLRYVEDYDVSKMKMDAEQIRIECEVFIKNSNVKNLRERLYVLYENLEDLENSVEFNKEDYDALKEHVKELNEKINKLKYRKDPDKYNSMSYSECQYVDSLLVNLLDEYRDLESITCGYLSEYESKDSDERTKMLQTLSKLGVRIPNLESELSELYKSVHYIEGSIDDSYTKDLKPINCNVPTCAFLLKVNDNESKRDQLSKTYKEIEKLERELSKVSESYKSLEEQLSWISLIDRFMVSIRNNAKMIEKYTDVSPSKLEKSIFKGKFGEMVDFKVLREYLSILSEKEVYNSLKYDKIPKIESKLKLYEMKVDNAMRLEKEIKRTNEEIQKISLLIDKEEGEYKEKNKLLGRTKEQIEKLDGMLKDSKELERCRKELSDLIPEYDKNRDALEKIMSSESVLKDYKRTYKELFETVKKVEKDKELIGYELLQSIDLTTELMAIEQKFFIADTIVSMIRPGQKMMKDSTEMFLDDIVDMTNILLTKCMDGKLVLAPFDIDDGVFNIPFVYNGTMGDDIKYGSSAQRSLSDKCLGLALLAKVVSDVGIIAMDEPDSKLSPKVKARFIKILVDFLKYIGIRTSFIISHNPDNFRGHDVGYIVFPGADAPDSDDVVIID
jgi:DNA repair exonuclease SbcCD ATPase subunit